MSQRLIDHSGDLRRLRDEGYEVEVRDGHLLLHNVPYVTSGRNVGHGTLVSTLSLAGDQTTRPDTHVAFFSGEFPCHRDGNPIEALRHGSARQQLAAGITVDHSFSNKPDAGYADYYEKMTTYANILSGPAMAIDAQVTPRTFASVVETADDSPLVYSDTSSSRYGITSIVQKLRGQRVAIVGLGGTGSYVLDLVAKTPVDEIHLFDGDEFVSHNAFRAPGAPTLDDLRLAKNKAERFATLYSAMHRGIRAHPSFIDSSNVEELVRMTFVFVCVDRGDAKRVIFSRLRAAGIPAIDVGIGIEVHDDALLGIVRTTAFLNRNYAQVENRIPMQDEGNDVYRAAVQVADLNMLNAALAVIKWKKLLGFYQDVERELNTTYTINLNMVVNDVHEA